MINEAINHFVERGSKVFSCFLDVCKGHFPLGGVFRAERHFVLFKDQLAESGSQKTKENIIPRGKFRQVENGPKAFDTVWIDGLFFKLFSELKVQGKILSILKILYSKTQCFVYFNGSTSDKFDVLQGTGQGRNLAVFMYKVYV